ncbi:hypothetical protein CGCA056_v005307 [Colletotrichum aenigma]|uniref:uncharacterized protein n=1 Tax=Colletotrichum aenigma TaxID=1215731 RepID=UPI00187252A1|nr:uncharacterized protein CGCA056_v005307 [Colletotrichum aenigma]KAF5524558.1 hypothetical protein CGCA056_v005307 [Colletotrichum aenigma]
MYQEELYFLETFAIDRQLSQRFNEEEDTDEEDTDEEDADEEEDAGQAEDKIAETENRHDDVGAEFPTPRLAHPNHACEQDQVTHEVLRIAAENNWQRCPHFQVIIELNQGCYHISKSGRHAACDCDQWDEEDLLDAYEQNYNAYEENYNARAEIYNAARGGIQ